jgi:hypothetical protein
LEITCKQDAAYFIVIYSGEGGRERHQKTEKWAHSKFELLFTIMDGRRSVALLQYFHI